MGIFARIADRMDRQSGLMGAMLKRRHVDLENLVGAGSDMQMGAAIRSCMACRSSGECQNWLESDDGTESDFCPNARFFDQYAK